MDPPLLGLVKSPMVVDLDKPFTPLGKGNGSDDGGSSITLRIPWLASDSLLIKDFAKLDKTPKKGIFNGLVQDVVKVCCPMYL